MKYVLSVDVDDMNPNTLKPFNARKVYVDIGDSYINGGEFTGVCEVLDQGIVVLNHPIPYERILFIETLE